MPHESDAAAHPFSRVGGLHHISLTVSDLGRSVAWYHDVLGL